MATGLEISTEFINTTLLPLLKADLPGDFDQLAVAVIGTGSDVLGWDDTISRDHHWGPRANVLYPRRLKDRLAPQVQTLLKQRLPSDYHGFEIHVDIGNLTGVCCCAIEDLQERFIGTDALPQEESDWLGYCEVDLFHLTHGTIVFDGLGEMTERSEILAYYPDNVWKKRIADWCMYITGRDAPYNLYRVSKRGDQLTSTVYLGQYMKKVMELCFTLNRQYAPYTKWLNRAYSKLPKYAEGIVPVMDQILETPDWKERVFLMIDINYLIADALADLGLTEKANRRPFDEGLTDLTLYDSAAQIYRTLPKELLAPSFNTIELWEKMARDVLFDTNDYFHKKYDANTRVSS